MDIQKCKEVGHFDDKKRRQALFCLDINEHMGWLAVGGIDSSVSIWSCGDGERPFELLSTLSRHDGAVLSLQWAPPTLCPSGSPAIFASSSDDSMVFVWQQETSNQPYVTC